MNVVSSASLRMSVVKMAYNLSLTTKILCPSLVLSLLLSFLFNPLKALAVTPGLLIPPNFWIWTIVTHSFIETDIFLLICGIVSLTISENMLDQWNSVKLAIFYGIIAAASSVIGSLFYLMLYMATFNIDYLYGVHIYGTGSLVGGALIAAVQTYGDYTPVQMIGVPLRLVPLASVFLMIALRIFGLLRGSYLLAFGLGLLVSWVFLRFYQNHSRGRGDQSKTFAFKCFFPKPLQGPVSVVSDIVYNFLLTTRICKKTVYRYDVGAPNNIKLTITGIQSLDAERRRWVNKHRIFSYCIAASYPSHFYFTETKLLRRWMND